MDRSSLSLISGTTKPYCLANLRRIFATRCASSLWVLTNDAEICLPRHSSISTVFS